MKKSVIIILLCLIAGFRAQAQCNPDAGPDDMTCYEVYTFSASLGDITSTGYWTTNGYTSFMTDTTWPNATVSFPVQGAYWFYWHEENTVYSCTAVDSVQITYHIIFNYPDAGSDFSVCGYEAQLNPDTAGGNYSSTWWHAMNGLITFNNNYDPYAIADITNLGPGIFGTDCSVTIDFFWDVVVDSSTCPGYDTVAVTFYQPAVANAGSDDYICGNQYNLQAVESINCSAGNWSVVSSPPGAQVVFDQLSNPGALVTVTEYGTYLFRWEEANENFPGCTSADTVEILFIEIPHAEAGPDWDTACGLEYYMNAVPSVGTGMWYVLYDPAIIYFYDTYNTYSSIYNDTVAAGHPSYNTATPFFEFVWTEDNGGCTDSDTIRILFAGIPNGNFETSVPFCRGMWSEINAEVDISINDTNYCVENFLWTYPGGILDTTWMIAQGYSISPLGKDIDVYWPGSADSIHPVTLKTQNCYGCWSPEVTFYVYEPPSFNANFGVYSNAYCGAGGMIYLDHEGSTYEYLWLADSTWLDPAGNDIPLSGGVYHSMNYDVFNDTLLIENLVGGIEYPVIILGESQSPEPGAIGYMCYDTLNIFVPDSFSGSVAGQLLDISLPLGQNEGHVAAYIDDNGFMQFTGQGNISSSSEYSLLFTQQGNYLLKGIVDDHVTYPSLMNTYYNGETGWQLATLVPLQCGDSIQLDIQMARTAPISSGTGSVSGTILYENTSDPVSKADVFLSDSLVNYPCMATQTDMTGIYQFSGIPAGSYEILVDIPGLPLISSHHFTVTATTTQFTGYDFYVDTVISRLTGIGIFADTTNTSNAIETVFAGITVSVYPNPFSDHINIDYSLDNTTDVSLDIIDMNGRTVRELVRMEQQSGEQHYEIIGLEAGVYYVVLKTGHSCWVKKIISQ
ncbi:MAG: T9SS type A sorting domain-containing protein [Bacteroidota bacterium]